MQRDAGYYWVRSADEWQIAEWFTDGAFWEKPELLEGYWYIVGADDPWADHSFDEIGPGLGTGPVRAYWRNAINSEPRLLSRLAVRSVRLLFSPPHLRDLDHDVLDLVDDF